MYRAAPRATLGARAKIFTPAKPFVPEDVRARLLEFFRRIPAENRSFTSDGNELCEGPLAIVILKIFIPLAISLLLSSTIGIVDMHLAGFLGPAAQAAVGMGDQLLFLVLVLGSGLSTACSSFVGQAAGANDFEACRRYAKASLKLGTCAGIISCIVAVVFVHPVLDLCGCPNEITVLAAPYTVLNSPANLPFVVCLCLSSIFRALAKPNYAVIMWLTIALISNGIASMLFFSGVAQTHTLADLATGWTLGCSAGCMLGLILFRQLDRQLGEAAKDAAMSSKQKLAVPSKICFMELGTVLEVAAPAMVSELCFVLSNLILYGLMGVSEHSTVMQAAWSIKLKLEETLAILPLMALGMSCSVVIAQNHGRSCSGRVRKTGLGTAIAATAAMLLLGAICTANAREFAGAFGTDTETKQILSDLLSWSMLFFPLTGLGTICAAALEGTGNTKAPLTINILMQLILRLGLCWWSLNQHSQTPAITTDSVDVTPLGIAICLVQFLWACSMLWQFNAKHRQFSES
jgi:putative MATE family efflux protein